MNTSTPSLGSVPVARHIFISHASADDEFVAQLRKKLEGLDLSVWADSRNLRGGDKLAPEVARAIEEARQFLVVLSPNTVNSPWVRREITKALKVEKLRRDQGYRVIPLLVPGITPKALENWFDEEPVAIQVELGPGGLIAAFPEVLAALGERLPTDHEGIFEPDAKPLEDLVLRLTYPKIDVVARNQFVTATATLIYEPADRRSRSVESLRFSFAAPLGLIEADELRWYLESYYAWPVGVFKVRAESIEKRLPQWGEDLFRAAVGATATREALTAWQASTGGEHRFSVEVDSDLPEGTAAEIQASAREAAAELLALPWELMHDGRGWLFQGNNPSRVRRRLPNRRAQGTRASGLPIRILLLSPRPEQDAKGKPVAYIYHRVSARPLVEAAEMLAELVQLTVLTPPTYAAMEKAIQDAADRQEPIDVVHFDGHGVYDRRLGLGCLCFEDSKDSAKLEKRTMEFVDASRLAGLFRQHRIPLVFLEACQTAKAEANPTASVAARLLEEGVSSVVAMSHSVLVETGRRFVQAFYKSLAEGARVGKAMLVGQRALHADTWRGRIMGAGDLRLQDWFVPVIYQEEHDPQLVTKTPGKRARQLEARRRGLSLGALPEPPSHEFQGRSRELLALERMLDAQPWAVILAMGGAGKTTLAVELARWLNRTGRFERAAFVSLERYRDARAVLDTLARQLLPGGEKYSVAQHPDMARAFQPVERALADRRTIIVLDNFESVLPSHAEIQDFESDLPAILSLCERMLAADQHTRLVFTSREPLPSPFDHHGRHCELGALDLEDAVNLVSHVLANEGLVLPPADCGNTPKEITNLVEAVRCHARAMVLLAREAARQGVMATAANLHLLMDALERKHPGDRENSLYASVELSLRRLSPALREHVKMLAMCRGGVHRAILTMITGQGADDAQRLADELVELGLAEDSARGHLRLDPGLAPYLLGGMNAEEKDALCCRWAEAMATLTELMRNDVTRRPGVTASLAPSELPNLLAMLEWYRDHSTPERVVELAGQVETLVGNVGRPQALATVVRIREQASKKLGGWGHAQFVNEEANIDRYLGRHEWIAAKEAASRLVEKTLDAGETAYSEAAYDTAIAHLTLGRALRNSGAAEAALGTLADARRRFQLLADSGVAVAKRMVAVAIGEAGDCFFRLRRLEEAEAARA